MKNEIKRIISLIILIMTISILGLTIRVNAADFSFENQMGNTSEPPMLGGVFDNVTVNYNEINLFPVDPDGPLGGSRKFDWYCAEHTVWYCTSDNSYGVRFKSGGSLITKHGVGEGKHAASPTADVPTGSEHMYYIDQYTYKNVIKNSSHKNYPSFYHERICKGLHELGIHT